MSIRRSVRVIELRQRERRAQLETPCLLLLRDGDCSEERILGRGGVRRIALEQNLAAQAMQESVRPVLSRLMREPEPLVNSRQGLFYVLPFGFDLGEQSLKEWDPILGFSPGKSQDGLSKLRDADFIVATIA